MESTTTSTSTAAQNDPGAQMPSPPQQEHTWLQKLVGNWTFESECAAEPGQPAQKYRGTEKVRAFGDLWTIAEGEGEMPGGGTGRMMITLGFDPKRNRFVGTFVGSMMSYLWVYEGELDASGRILTLNAEGPSFADPQKLASYQDIIEVKSDNHRTLSSRVREENGQWTNFMTARYRRTK